MFLSIATTHSPATDLGFLLMKHPDRTHEVELSFGKAVVFFPQADAQRCEAALALDLDPVALVRGRGGADGVMDQYVNDRPYAASSFLSVALNKAFRTAMTGVSRERPELAQSAIPLEITIAPLPSSDDLPERLFAPLGWRVEARRIETSRYVELRLSGTLRLADALSHIYVLIPALDADKHYWVGDDEVGKLVSKAGPWLAAHPERETIARRYLKNRRGLARAALALLLQDPAPDEPSESTPRREEALEAPLRLHDRRLDTVAVLLKETGARAVADLGCGEGRLLQRLAKDRAFEKLIGIDASSRDLERARERLKLDVAGGASRERVQLLHGALTYRDARWAEVDAAALVEVIEHLDEDRLPALADAVFGAARPKVVIVTTPNAEYNRLFETLPDGQFRHPDHRFEFTRPQFSAWAQAVAERYGYSVAFSGIGEEHPEFGPVSQVGVFSR
ncbi:3' terminal RNA ribose 2'-O-methyltransferase Hen1 [Methylocystis heyeri]|uniref:Small RNA 2'-O-methyltransferase n=1 Tax=Methylocystis heyeri TaxID=391905 RepID=A0A6B8KKE9_9HYPH|nr:3' terminal RNA ribose 2'-O-methyltransferase Hen1 [Methylocystis heyeri]QGM47128.1 3' terminal RNA ribose 2'-O-methyltransferase Hen1 [Methylocystis heyeri]